MKQLTFLFFILLSTSVFAQNKEQPLQIAPFSVWSQRMDMSAYIGKKYRLQIAIRVDSKDPEAIAVPFIRNEYPAGGKEAWVYMDNMMNHPARDSTWNTYTLEYEVEKKAPWLGFGMLGFGNGKFYFDALRIAVETAPDHWTEIDVQNGDFESETVEPWQQTSMGVPARILGATASTVKYEPFEGERCFLIENVFMKR